MVATAGTIQGYGPFVRGSLNESLLLLCGYMVMCSLVTLSLSSSISARERHANERLKEQTLVRDLLEGIPDPIFVKDQLGRYLVINAAGAAYLGKPRDEIIGRKVYQLLPPDRAQVIQDLDSQVMETGKEITRYLVREVNGVSRHFLHTRVPYVDHDGQVIGVIGIGRDITEVKQAAEAHQQMEALRQADAMKNRFLSLVSHELRSPLTVIDAYGHLLQDRLGPLNDRQSNAVIKILASARRQAQLINDLLDMGRVLAGKFTVNLQPIRMSPLIQEVVECQKPVADARKVRLSWTDETQQSGITGDSNRLEQVLTNLVGNAIKFTPADGSIQVRLSTDGSLLRCEVADTGPGIPPEQAHQIFQPFSQLGKNHHEGAGLGLAICKEIITAHGGRIGVTSKPEGNGSIFWFTIPRRKSTSLPPTADKPPNQAA
jgi:two-component system CheB/CheR fusion protein